MCMVLFAAADAPLPELPEGTTPASLSLRPIRGDEDPVRRHFTKAHVYFIGAHTGCSCGFQYGVGGAEDEAGRDSVQHLGAYLTAAMAQAGPVELYACWAGDEAEPEKERTIITAAAFSGEAEEFELAERWFATILAPAS